MLKKTLGILALSAIATMTWANVDLRTNIQDVFYRGTCEEAGAITMSVNGNDFNEASTMAPVYIRIRLNHQATLCQTLVAGFNPYTNDSCADRIYLAMRLEDGNQNNTIAANDESVNIERWVAGEDQLWLRVQTSSATWINLSGGGGLAPPSLANGRIAWTFGTTARTSVDQNESRFIAGRANAFANFRNDTIDTHAVSTLICVDLSSSNLTYLDNPNAPDDDSLLKFDTISFKYADMDEPAIFGNSATPPSNLIPQYGVNFSGDDTIARGYQKYCSGGIGGDKPGYAIGLLCVGANVENLNQNGLVCITNQVDIDVNCDGWFGDRSQFEEDADWNCAGCGDGTDPIYNLTNQAGVFLFKANSGNWGFHHWAVSTNSQLNARYLGTLDGYSAYLGTNKNKFIDVDPLRSGSQDILLGSHVRGGYYLADGVRVLWYGYEADGYGSKGSKSVTLQAEVCQYYADDPGPVELDVEILTNNYAKAQDDGEYCDLDQFAHCEPSMQIIEDFWAFGAFTECFGNPVSIFFPYVPRVTSTDPAEEITYWAGLNVVNQGLIDYEAGDINAYIYEADGTLWTAGFPALPSRANMTWLIMNDAQGVGFYGAAGDPISDGQFIAPTTEGNDLTPMDVRSSMFIVGTFIAEFQDNVFDGDLDGYLLIGDKATGSIDGAYLPRNYDNDIPGQNADLPLYRSKNRTSMDKSQIHDLQIHRN
jgi:hypothetical protein